MHPIAWALLSIALSVGAQFSLKSGMSAAGVRAALDQGGAVDIVRAVALQPGIVLGLALYALGAVAWMAVLARWDVSKAYPLVGLGFVLTLAVGALAGEAVGPQRLVGVLLIALGVATVART